MFKKMPASRNEARAAPSKQAHFVGAMLFRNWRLQKNQLELAIRSRKQTQNLSLVVFSLVERIRFGWLRSFGCASVRHQYARRL